MQPHYNNYMQFFLDLYRFQTGTWMYFVTTTDGSSASASVTVLGKNPKITIEAIDSDVYWYHTAIDDIVVGTEIIQTIHATVSQGASCATVTFIKAQCVSGYLPVVQANVTVTVERPGNDGPVTFMLLDDGAGGLYISCKPG